MPVAAIRCVAFTSNERLIDEFTGGREYLNAPAATIRDVHEAVGGDLHGVHRWHELRSPVGAHRLRQWPCVGAASSPPAFRCGRIVHRHAAERAPHPLEGTGVGVKDDDSLIAVSVRHEQFVRLRVNEYVGRLPEVLRVRVGLLLTALTDLHDELAGLGELQDLVIVAVAPDPDKAFRIDINSMLRFRPVITRPRAAPSLDEVAFSIEFQHWRRGLRLLFRAQRVRPLQHP